MNACVVDASVAIKWYLPEPHSEQALHLLRQCQQGVVAFHAPDLFVSEAGNILWKKVRRRAITSEEAAAISRNLLAVPVHLHLAKTLFPAALRLSLDAGTTFYDSLYVALAVALECPLVSADRRLLEAMQRAGLANTVCFLADAEHSLPAIP